MSPHFHFHPTLNELEAPARVANGEVGHPAAQDRVDMLNHPLHRLGSMSPEDFSKRLQQRRAFLHLGRVLRSPSSRQVADATEVKPQEPKAFASSEVDRSALLFVNLDVKFRQLFPQSLIDRLQQPAIARIRVDRSE